MSFNKFMDKAKETASKAKEVTQDAAARADSNLASGKDRAYPLTDPASMPRMKYRPRKM